MASITIINSEPSLYFPTGDVVLLSLPNRDDDVITAFKIHSQLLVQVSPVFEGMFALPRNEDVETYDNVPFVKLHDEASHLTSFLKALYDIRCVPWKKHDLSAVQTIEGILLLAIKYQVDSFHMVALLEGDWPSHLADWDDNEGEIKAKAANFYDRMAQMDGDFIMENEPLPDPCQVISLARKCNLPQLLPAAFYHLSRILTTKDRRLSPRYTAMTKGSYDGDLESGLFTDFPLLSAEDLRCLLVSREGLLQMFQGYLAQAYNAARDT